MAEIEMDTPVSLPPVRPPRAVIGAVTTTVACVLPVFLVGGLAVQIGHDLGFSPAGLGLAVSVYFGVGALASIPSGTLVDRYRPTAVARAGIVLSAASLAAIGALAHTYPALLGLLALSASANALGQLSSNVTLARHVPADRQGLAFGIKQAAIPISTLLAGAAVPVVALTAGWRWAFLASAGGALAALAVLPPGTIDRRPVRQPRRAAPAGRFTVPLILLGLAATLAAAAANALSTFLVDSSVRQGLAPGLAGLSLTGGSVVCAGARTLIGWLADRRTADHLSTIAGMLTAGSVGLALLALAGSAPLAAGVALGFGLGWAWPGLMNFTVVRLHPKAPGAAVSITQTGVYAGGCVGPLAFGSVASLAGYPTMWLTAAVAMLLAAGLMFAAGRLLTPGGSPAAGTPATAG